MSLAFYPIVIEQLFYTPVITWYKKQYHYSVTNSSYKHKNNLYRIFNKTEDQDTYRDCVSNSVFNASRVYNKRINAIKLLIARNNTAHMYVLMDFFQCCENGCLLTRYNN